MGQLSGLPKSFSPSKLVFSKATNLQFSVKLQVAACSYKALQDAKKKGLVTVCYSLSIPDSAEWHQMSLYYALLWYEAVALWNIFTLIPSMRRIDPSLFCLGTGTAPPFSGWENPW